MMRALGLEPSLYGRGYLAYASLRHSIETRKDPGSRGHSCPGVHVRQSAALHDAGLRNCSVGAHPGPAFETEIVLRQGRA